MPRRLLRDGRIVDDDWSYAGEIENNTAGALILTLAQWQNERDARITRRGQLGILLEAAHPLELITPELRAAGHVRRDQLFFMARCGFNSFELPDADIEAAHAALSTFSWAYQPANDAGLLLKLQHR